MTDGQVPNKAWKSEGKSETYAEVHRLAATVQLGETRERNSKLEKLNGV